MMLRLRRKLFGQFTRDSRCEVIAAQAFGWYPAEESLRISLLSATAFWLSFVICDLQKLDSKHDALQLRMSDDLRNASELLQ
jgi:hypothetical protein